VRDLSRHPVMVRIGSGDVYQDSVLRFAGSVLTCSASATRCRRFRRPATAALATV
jgi:hypothetical protein